MTREERYSYILNYFRETLPNVATELHFGSAFQLLVATLLSAQCTDKRINEVTPELFRHYPDAKTMATATVEDILEYVKSVSYPNAKSKHLLELSLTTLPGVGRKTANVVQSVWFGKPTLAVDTHVYRVSHRLGLVPHTANTPSKVEDYLMKNIPVEDVAKAHHWLLLHGRYVCKSAKPECGKCALADICPKIMKNSKLER